MYGEASTAPMNAHTRTRSHARKRTAALSSAPAVVLFHPQLGDDTLTSSDFSFPPSPVPSVSLPLSRYPSLSQMD